MTEWAERVLARLEREGVPRLSDDCDPADQSGWPRLTQTAQVAAALAALNRRLVAVERKTQGPASGDPEREAIKEDIALRRQLDEARVEIARLVARYDRLTALLPR